MKVTKKIKTMFVGDVHLSHTLFGIHELRKDKEICFEEACDFAIKSKVTNFVVCGDLFDNMFPNEETICFVKNNVARLLANNITPIGINGDHDKPRNNKNWICDVCGFLPPTGDSGVFGVNYCDDPCVVLDTLNKAKNVDQVEWIILHGQAVQLWPFCEDKKRLDLKQVSLSKFKNLKGFILGDIHKPLHGTMSDPINGSYEIHYTGSLGVVNMDECDKPGYLVTYEDGGLDRIKYKLTRGHIRVKHEDVSLDQLKDLIEKSTTEYCGNKPVIVVDYEKQSRQELDCYNDLARLCFLKKILKKTETQDEFVDLRAEVKKLVSPDEMLALFFSGATFDLAKSIVTAPEEVISILENYKKNTIV